MKKHLNKKRTSIILFGFVLVFANSANAQAGMTSTGQNTTMTVRLNDAISIEVLNPATMLEFASAADYQNGVTQTEAAALRVTSTRSYNLNVRCQDANLMHTDGTMIGVENIQVETPTVLTANYTVSLSTTDQLIATGSPDIKKEIDIVYRTNAQNLAFIGKSEGDYTVFIIYSVVSI